ncbi:hypothetical protein SteCoe_27129 [Stentor coeruleus]|uniref:Uncharacterized protein n=1 Tax=Stentor coeruleus TaxID=5963 RepID=A0A1R2BB65_9CILI|nr:hypothetical protein SteCoe_27129 [Stentor coeruleus]
MENKTCCFFNRNSSSSKQSASAKIKELEDEIKQYSQTIEKLTSEKEKFKGELDQSNLTNEKLSRDKEELVKQLHQCNETILGNDLKIVEMQKDYDIHKSSHDKNVQTHLLTLEKLRVEIQKKDSEIDRLSKNYIELEKLKISIEEDNKKNIDKILELNLKSQPFTDEIAYLKQKLQESDIINSSLKDANSNSNIKIESLSSQLENYLITIDYYKNELEKYCTTIESYKYSYNALNDSFNKLQENYTQLGCSYNALNDTYNKLQENYAQLEYSRNLLLEQNKIFQQNNVEVTKKISSSNDMINKLAAEKDALNKLLGDTVHERDRAENDKTLLLNEIREKTEFTVLLEDNKRMQNTIIEQQNEMDKLIHEREINRNSKDDIYYNQIIEELTKKLESFQSAE